MSVSGWVQYPHSFQDKFTTLKVSEAIQQLRDDNELLTALRIYDRLDSENIQKIIVAAINSKVQLRGLVCEHNWANGLHGHTIPRVVTELILCNEVGKLTTLEYLIIGFHYKVYLTSIPSSIGDLECLRLLDCSCKLQTVPKEVGNLTNLMELSLCDNRLETLPDELGRLTDLMRLSLCDNKLTTLPVTYSNLINLILLDVNDNKVDDAGAEDIKCIVAGHPTLLMLNLESNNIGEAGCNSLADLVLHLDVRYTTRRNYKILDGEITYFPSPPAPTCFINTTLMCLVLDDNPEGSLENYWKNERQKPFPHVIPGNGFISDKFVYVESMHLYDDYTAVAAGEMSYAYNNAEKKIEDILESARNEADEVPPPSGVTGVTGVTDVY